MRRDEKEHDVGVNTKKIDPPNLSELTTIRGTGVQLTAFERKTIRRRRG